MYMYWYSNICAKVFGANHLISNLASIYFYVWWHFTMYHWILLLHFFTYMRMSPWLPSGVRGRADGWGERLRQAQHPQPLTEGDRAHHRALGGRALRHRPPRPALAAAGWRHRWRKYRPLDTSNFHCLCSTVKRASCWHSEARRWNVTGGDDGRGRWREASRGWHSHWRRRRRRAEWRGRRGCGKTITSPPRTRRPTNCGEIVWCFRRYYEISLNTGSNYQSP